MKILVILLAFFGLSISTLAQQNTPALERVVSLKVENESVKSVLSEISTQTGVVFSYEQNAFDTKELVNLQVSKRSVRFVLNKIFGEKVLIKQHDKYIIIQKNKVYEQKQFSKKKVEGYIYASQTGEKLSNASVYNESMTAVAVTDRYGYFQIELPEGYENDKLIVSKRGYSDTVIVQRNPTQEFIDVVIPQTFAHAKAFTDSLHINERIRRFPELILPSDLKANSENLPDSFRRNFQFSILPYVGTDGKFSGNYNYDMSINMLGGYVGGVNHLELGGIFNVDRHNLHGLQGAGVLNFVGDTVDGLQGAGIFNYAGYVDGLQAAGTVNVANAMNGAQLSGNVNYLILPSKGLQAAGNVNVAGDLQGMQASGIVNFASKMHGMQAAGVANYAKALVGPQFAGIVNVSDNQKGSQFAGVVNCSDSIQGFQIAGIYNSASYVKGLQLGLVNYADSCDGLSIGLIPFVRNGYHKMELSYDETSFANLGARLGTKRFHTNWFGGLKTDNFSDPLYTFGFGLGTTFLLKNKLYMDIDLSDQQIYKGHTYAYENSLTKIYVGIDRLITPKFSIAFGLSYNFFVCDVDDPDYSSSYSKLMPYTITDNDMGSHHNLTTWAGARLALRFF
jgi:hypothetical protein